MKPIFVIFLLSFFSVSHGQTGMWTWMGGGVSGGKSVYGTMGLPQPTNMVGNRFSSCGWQDTSGKFWLFGGYGNASGGTGDLNDLWKFDPMLNEWTWMKGDTITSGTSIYGVQGQFSSNNKPRARYSSNSFIEKDNLWLYGGFTFSRTGYLNLGDLWKYNIHLNQWMWIKGDTVGNGSSIYGTKGIEASSNTPGSIESATTWSDSSGNLWLFGGYSVWGKYHDALWKLNVSNNNWVWLTGSNWPIQGLNNQYGIKGIPSASNNPSARAGGVSWTDKNGNLWLFGGGISSSNQQQFFYFNDLWKYNPNMSQWTWISGDSGFNKAGVFGIKNVSSISNHPSSRGGSVTWRDTLGNLWLFGGYYNGNKMNDLWKYNIASNEWTWVSGDSTANSNGNYGTKGVESSLNNPSARSSSVGWVDKVNNLWFFGGSTPSSGLALCHDLWRFRPFVNLPLHLLTFNVNLKDKSTRLQWTSENEQNFSHYEIERSTNSKEWHNVGTVNWKGGSSKNEYSYQDDLSGQSLVVNRLYYRLKMVDKDGSFTYSNIVNIRLGNQQSFSIYPNPATTSVQLQFDKSINEKVEVKVVGVNGKIVVSRKLIVVSGQSTLSTNKLAVGSYLVQVKVGDEVYNQKLIIK